MPDASSRYIRGLLRRAADAGWPARRVRCGRLPEASTPPLCRACAKAVAPVPLPLFFPGRSGCMTAGRIVALVTPMDAQGGLDWNALSKLVDFHLQEGTNAIVAVGTTGESATLDVGEHIEVIRRVVDQVAGRIPVIAGTGANSTREAVELTENARSAGADACLLVTPYYNKPTQEGLYQHFRHIGEAVAIPQILYNVPSRTACDMLPETVERLSKIDN